MANKKILLVDDTKLILELMKNTLKLSPLQVLTAGDGVEALDIVRKELPDLIIMDVNMPRMGGIECCAILKADPFLCSIPIIMLTTMGNEENRENCSNAGCDDFLTKPIDRHLFLAKAHQYIDTVERRDTRAPCQVPLIFRLSGVVTVGESSNISEGGIYVSSEQVVIRADSVELAFFLPMPDAPAILVHGKVSWTNSAHHRVKPELPVGFGVKFLDLDGKHQAQIRTLVSSSAKASAD